MQVRLQTRALDGPKGMLGTFVHILKANGVSGLYSGVRFSHHLHRLSLPPISKPSNLIKFLPALRLPPPPINLLHHPLRHLLGTQRSLHDRALLPLPPLLNRHGQHFRLPGRNSRQPSRRTERAHAARRRFTR